MRHVLFFPIAQLVPPKRDYLSPDVTYAQYATTSPKFPFYAILHEKLPCLEKLGVVFGQLI